jgi:type II secretory pathway component PulM
LTEQSQDAVANLQTEPTSLLLWAVALLLVVVVGLLLLLWAPESCRREDTASS